MSKADKMFEKLGYEKIYEDDLFTQYDGKVTNIEISKNEVLINKKTKYKTVILTRPELQAINLKCKELGWLDE